MNNTRTHISRKHGAMQINLDNWTFWFTKEKGDGNWYNLSNKTIEHWTSSKSPLTKRDKEWFINAINS